MYLLAAFASLVGGLGLIYRMVQESEPELTDQEAPDGPSKETEQGDLNGVASFSPLL